MKEKEIEVEGRTVQEAIKKGLKDLGLSQSDVKIKVLNEGKTGLFGLMGASPAKVKISLNTPLKKSKKEISDNPESTPASTAALADAAQKVQKELKKILSLMHIESSVTASVDGEYIHADIVTNDSALLIGRKGQTLNALELLINTILNNNYAAPRIKTIVDTAGYRAKRKIALEYLALDASAKVKSTGKNMALEPMNSSERRTIHMLLKDNPDVQTSSEGKGEARRVIISPKNAT